MKQQFENIKEFLAVRKQCIFCKKKLKTKLEFTLLPYDIKYNTLRLDSKLSWNKLRFNLSFLSNNQIRYNIGGWIKLYDNKVYLSKIDYKIGVDVINDFDFSVMKYCDCDYWYDVSTKTIFFDNEINKIEYPRLGLETFKLNNRTILNDFNYFRVIKHEPPYQQITLPSIDFTRLTPEQINKKIKLLILFS